ncbi:MAG: hypothetical protein AB8B56_18705 [Crocinitomicaceae bacterium]
MKALHFTAPVALFITAFILFSCEKENRIEKNLWKKGGDWKVEYYLINQPTSDNVWLDCGFFHFDRSGEGSYVLNLDGNLETRDFEYEVDYSASSSGGGYRLTLVDNFLDTLEYTVDWNKNSIKMSSDESFESFYLKKSE